MMAVKSGGRGCLPNYTLMVKQREKKEAQALAAWEASPAGRAAAERLLITARAAAERLLIMAAARERERRQSWEALVQQVRQDEEKAVDRVLYSNGTAVIASTMHEGRPSFFTWRYFTAVYPDYPVYELQAKQDGRFGLRCLINKASREELMRRYPDYQIGDKVPVLAVKVTGYSVTGKSAHCDVIEWGTHRAPLTAIQLTEQP